ncbi:MULTISPECIES: DUF445 family protein [Cyanophyceae]|uniref:DUF445 domain-containing protein n=1 Tax=Cyanophyceae TaxID=3028117 RepID=UPI0016848026|nr:MULTISPECIES: DUF445 family protein [Cyanophyceae]MBD1918573.1 DUF445 family protein [Phormidium sp. FACHB-77]MBD2031462.1 DUF445 family protein [Phormidium sp. FACHB-322]MBD2049581.1 DUF445 family protein [Leptolyngbya sp. FACHB-60]
MTGSELWLLLAPPIVGGIIGYFTNDIAIKMLFRPYRPIYLGKRQLPFTPGLIPSNQERLAQRISDTIMGSLLTPHELQNLARRLLQTDRTQAAIKWLLQLALDQVQSRAQDRTAKIAGAILQDLFGKSLPRLIRVWARREDFLEPQLNQLFDQVLLDFKLTADQSDQIATWLLSGVFPPDKLRQLTVDFLTDRNIQVIDTIFRERTSGTYWVVANLFGVRNALSRLRAFCLDEREVSNARIAELVVALQLKKRLKESLQRVSLQNLPVSTVRQVRRNLRESLQGYIRTLGPAFVKNLGNSVNWETLATQLLNRLQNSEVITKSLDPVSEELALILERYLERDLESLVAQIIPILNIDQVIIDRVRGTSAKELELAIQGIVRSELQAIVNLGGILGFAIGLLQSGFFYFQRSGGV